jgi:hypothetical protein
MLFPFFDKNSKGISYGSIILEPGKMGNRQQTEIPAHFLID